MLIAIARGRWVGSGRTLSGGGGTVFVRVGERARRARYRDDWVLVHEMIHLTFPSVAREQDWAEEGIATYVEPFARVRAGLLSQEEAWASLAEGLPNGLPRDGDKGLDHTHTWGRVYWGGALFWFLADVEIHKRTQNRMGLEQALRGINAAGGTNATRWPLEDVMTAGDKATGVPVLRELYATMSASPIGRHSCAARVLGVEVREAAHASTITPRSPMSGAPSPTERRPDEASDSLRPGPPSSSTLASASASAQVETTARRRGARGEGRGRNAGLRGPSSSPLVQDQRPRDGVLPPARRLVDRGLPDAVHGRCRGRYRAAHHDGWYEEEPHSYIVPSDEGSEVSVEVKPASVGPLVGGIVMMGVGGAFVISGLFLLAVSDLNTTGADQLKTAGYVITGIGAVSAVGGLLWLLNRSHEPRTTDGPIRQTYGRAETLLGDVAALRPARPDHERARRAHAAALRLHVLRSARARPLRLK